MRGEEKMRALAWNSWHTHIHERAFLQETRRQQWQNTVTHGNTHKRQHIIHVISVSNHIIKKNPQIQRGLYFNSLTDSLALYISLTRTHAHTHTQTHTHTQPALRRNDTNACGLWFPQKVLQLSTSPRWLHRKKIS